MNEKTFSENARRRCREIMTREVQTANRQMSLQEVACLMREGDMGAMPVVEDGKLVGVLSRAVLQRRLAEDEPPSEDEL